MPMVYVKEMVADWFGAGKAITGKINGHEVKVNWDGENEHALIRTKQGVHTPIPVAWITDIKEVQPEPQFKWGDRVEVSDDGKKWFEAIYIGIEISNLHHCFAKGFIMPTNWDHCRHLVAKEPLTCKEVMEQAKAKEEKPEHESYRNLYPHNIGVKCDDVDEANSCAEPNRIGILKYTVTKGKPDVEIIKTTDQ